MRYKEIIKTLPNIYYMSHVMTRHYTLLYLESRSNAGGEFQASVGFITDHINVVIEVSVAVVVVLFSKGSLCDVCLCVLYL